MSTEAELVDLPEDQKPKVKICSPKLVILVILSLYFVGQNLYVHFTKPIPLTPPPPTPDIDQWAQFWQLFDRFQNYIYISVVGFIGFYFLRQSNDKFQEEKYLKEKAREEAVQEAARKLQSEREERIIRKMEEEERLADEKQMRMSASNLEPKKNKVKEEQKDKEV